jgi:hypothetical protein
VHIRHTQSVHTDHTREPRAVSAGNAARAAAMQADRREDVR